MEIPSVCRREASGGSVEWKDRRAVMFLDPYGTQVAWDTLVCIAETKAIDLWLLFPLGVAVNRMLPASGDVPPAWSQRLDSLFGTHEWYDAFYVRRTEPTLFGEEERLTKVGLSQMGEFFIRRLKTIFHTVADKPRFLYNSKNSPLFMLCFAAGNPKGGPTAKKIASHILGMCAP